MSKKPKNKPQNSQKSSSSNAKKPKSTATNQPNYEQIGRMLVSVYESGYIRSGRMIKMSLLRGIATGFGTVLGATIVVALLVWLLSVFSDIPFFGPWFEGIRESIEAQAPTNGNGAPL